MFTKNCYEGSKGLPFTDRKPDEDKNLSELLIQSKAVELFCEATILNQISYKL